MKFLRKLLFFFICIIIIVLLFCFAVGYVTYSKALEKEPLISRIDDVQSKEHYTKYDDISKNYLNAVVAAEDHRFYNHGAIDIIGICRAIYTNIRNKELQEGGSTITQQLAKNVVFNQEVSFSRKCGEVLAAFEIEKNYSKNEILELYVNTCYFGDGYYGIYDASYGYYKKAPSDLTLDEATMLAGIPNAPSVYSPSVNPSLAKQRQNYVINKMKQYGYLTNSDTF